MHCFGLDSMRAAGLEVELQPFVHRGKPGANVVGTLRGPGDDFVVIGAHHDTDLGDDALLTETATIRIADEVAREESAEEGRVADALGHGDRTEPRKDTQA